MKRVIIILSMFIVPRFAHAQQNIDLEKVDAEGLTNFIIKCIQQDDKGFLWFGTEEGLFRYDGYNFKPFKNLPGDNKTLINNNIEFLFPEKSLLWVGSRGGLSCIDINTMQITNFAPAEPVKVYAVVTENDSVFWIGTASGLFQFNKKSKQWKRINAINKSIFIRSVCNDEKNHSLYITSHNGFYTYDKLTAALTHYALPCRSVDPSSQIMHKSFIGKDGMVWMSSWQSGLIQFNPYTKQIKQWLYNKDDSVSPQPYIRAYDIVNKDGNIWIANSEEGLSIFNVSGHAITSYPVHWNNENATINKVISLFPDRSGIWWVGTENGVYKDDPHMMHLSKTSFTLKTDTGLVSTQLSPLCMLKENDKLWWIGGYKGLYLLNATTGILHDYTVQAGIPKSTIVTNIIKDSAGTFWLASRGMIVSLQMHQHGNDFSFQRTVYKSPDLQSVVSALYLDHENRLWIGTHANGILMLNIQTKKIIAYPNEEKNNQLENEIRCFYELNKDSLLIAGDGTGLLLLHTNNGTYNKILWNKKVARSANELSINAIIKTDSSYWIATELNGLWKSDDKFHHVIRYNTDDGLPSLNITAIMPDKRKHLWLITEGGLVDFQPFTDNSRPVIDQAIIYDKKDGLESLSNLACINRDDANNIVISDMGCIHTLNPYRVEKNNKPAPVVITGFKVFDKEYAFSNDQPVVLEYNENYFSFEYVELNYTQPSLNMYAYKMDGLDTAWNEADTRRYVSYAGLKEGTYTFEVKAGNNEGIWNTAPATITLIIKPPYWHTWWFYMLVILVIAGIFYAVYKVKLNQLKVKYQLRNKIARDLHDDIGSTLSGINIFSKIALQKIETDKTESTALLQKISDRSKKTMDALSDIVWSINTKNDNMDNIIAKMQEYISETLEPQAIEYNFEIDAGIRNTKPGMEIRKDLYLIFKEAVYNACKYAQCNLINIVMKRNKAIWTLLIQDDGNGFDMSQITPGNGISNMKRRASKMNAKISIKSEVGKGTIIFLEFNIT